MVAAPGDDPRRRDSEARWRYAGRFAKPPRPDEVEKLLQVELTRARDEASSRPAPGPAPTRW